MKLIPMHSRYKIVLNACSLILSKKYICSIISWFWSIRNIRILRIMSPYMLGGSPKIRGLPHTKI